MTALHRRFLALAFASVSFSLVAKDGSIYEWPHWLHGKTALTCGRSIEARTFAHVLESMPFDKGSKLTPADLMLLSWIPWKEWTTIVEQIGEDPGWPRSVIVEPTDGRSHWALRGDLDAGLHINGEGLDKLRTVMISARDGKTPNFYFLELHMARNIKVPATRTKHELENFCRQFLSMENLRWLRKDPKCRVLHNFKNPKDMNFIVVFPPLRMLPENLALLREIARGFGLLNFY
jgi:hypothetical protein